MASQTTPCFSSHSFVNSDEEYLYISPEGLKGLSDRKIDINAAKDMMWTTDYTLELPIKMKKKGPGQKKIQNPYIILLSFIKSIPLSSKWPFP